ncbi:hypothetical protein ACVRQH_005190, partial [Escherichia coli]
LRERVRVRGNMRADALTPALSHREREKSSARCYNAHRSVPSPLRERARVRGNKPLLTHQTTGHSRGLQH